VEKRPARACGRGVGQEKSEETPRRGLWAGRRAVEKWRSALPGLVGGAEGSGKVEKRPARGCERGVGQEKSEETPRLGKRAGACEPNHNIEIN